MKEPWDAAPPATATPTTATPDGAMTRRARMGLVLAALCLPIFAVPGSPSIAPQVAWSADRTSISLSTFALIFAVVALSFGTLMRLSGLPSVAHGALWGVGAYTAGALTNDLGWEFLATLPLAILVPAAVAAVIGLPAFRTSGVAFLVITIGLAEFLVLVLTNATSITNGPNGLNVIGVPTGVGPFDLSDPHDRYYLTLAGLYIAVAVVWLVTRSRFGRRLEMIRDNEPLARSVGFDPRLYKLGIFTLTAGLTGAAGQLYLYHQQAITPDLFGTYAFIPVILMAVLGGVGSIAGPVIGAYLVMFTPTWLGSAGLDDPDTKTLVYGAALVAVMAIAPSGITGLAAAAGSAVTRFARRGFARRPPRDYASAVPITIPADSGAPHDPAATTAVARPVVGEPLLEVRGLTKRFGAVRALDAVDLTVRAGEILGIIGPNGSGKTTLFNCISGFVSSQGTIIWRGSSLRARSPQWLARRGLVRTFQQPTAFRSMTPRQACGQVLDVRRTQAGAVGVSNSAIDLLGFCGLTPVADSRLEVLSYGQQRLLGVALALAARPRLLMLDEPAAGLNDHECVALRSLLEQIRAADVTVAVVDHDMGFLLPLCDRVVVLDAGQFVTEGLPAEVVRDPRVIAAYLGERFAAPLDLVRD